MFEKLYTADRSRAMLLRLRSIGVSEAAFLVGKLVLPFLFFLAVLLVALLILGRRLEVVWNVRSILSAVLGAAVVSVSAAAVMIGLRRGAPILLFGTLLGLFMCGGLVPRQMLGRWILLVGDLTPLGAVRAVLAPLLGGELPLAALIAVLTVAFILPPLFKLVKKK